MVPCFQFDYLFLTKSGKILTRAELLEDSEEVALKILVAKDSWTKAVFAHVVDRKGVDEQKYIIDRLMEDLSWLGFSRVTLRSDNERSIVKVLKQALVTARVEVIDDDGDPPNQLTEEHSARYDSQSAGDIEVAVRDVKGILTSNKLCLEDRIKRRVPCDHVLLSWLVEHVAWILTTRRRGEDGLTAYQRCRGRDYTRRAIGFAEQVLYKLPKKGPNVSADLQGNWQLGTVLGYATTSSEYWVFDGSRPVLCRDIKRRPGSERWNAEAVAAVAVHRHDLHQPRAPKTMPVDDGAPPPQVARGRRVQRILLKRQDFVDHGLTEDCPKCDAAKKYGWGQWGSSNKNHSVQCRERIEAELQKTAEGRRRLAEAQLREDRWLARQVELGDQVDAPKTSSLRPRFPELGDHDAGSPGSGHPEEGEIADDRPFDGGAHGHEAPMTPPNNFSTVPSITAR